MEEGEPVTLTETQDHLSTFAAGRVLLGMLERGERAERERDEAQGRFSVLFAFLKWVRTRDWTLAQLDERARDLDFEGPAEIGINVVAERDALREALRDAVHSFHEKCHPGHPALKAMVETTRIDRWRALAYPKVDR